MCSLQVFPTNLWEAANSDARQRCGDILVSLDEPVSLALRCIYCNFVVNDKLNIFWRHINEKHKSALALKSLETAVKQEILLEVVHETYKTELVDDVAADPLQPEELKDDGLVIENAGEILKIETEHIVEQSLVEQPKDTEESETDDPTHDDDDVDGNVKHFDCTNTKKSIRPTSHHICRIIELLEQQPTLWNTQLHTHYIRHERQEAVLSITNQMLAEFTDLTIDRRYVLNKVKHLKNLYIKYDNKNIQYNYTKNDKQYYEMLHFLSAHAPPTTEDQKNYCILCKKSVSILTKHMARFHQEGEKPQTCQMCDAMLPSERHLKMHMRSEHRRYECEYCDRAPYACAKGLRHHVSVVHPEQPSTLLADRTKNARAQPWPKERICEYCGRQFKAQKNLRAHKKTVHLQLRPYACADCPKAFKTKDKLKSHMNSTHLNLREHSCDICAKAFFDRKTMVQHKRLHSDVKNYMCKVCNKAFRQAPALHSHMKTHR